MILFIFYRAFDPITILRKNLILQISVSLSNLYFSLYIRFHSHHDNCGHGLGCSHSSSSIPVVTMIVLVNACVEVRAVGTVLARLATQYTVSIGTWGTSYPGVRTCAAYNG